jgi:hypothetical protein
MQRRRATRKVMFMRKTSPNGADTAETGTLAYCTRLALLALHH